MPFPLHVHFRISFSVSSNNCAGILLKIMIHILIDYLAVLWIMGRQEWKKRDQLQSDAVFRIEVMVTLHWWWKT